MLVLWGADKMTDGSVALARKFNISELVIGLTVVAFGTSLPELVVSLTAAIKGSSALSLGNIVGSNIFNVLAIVGCSALVCPIVVGKGTIYKDVPFALLASWILMVVCSDIYLGDGIDNVISRGDGFILLGFFAVFMAYTFSIAKNDNVGMETKSTALVMSNSRIVFSILIGITCLIGGGNLFVSSASEIALSLGVSEAVVGLTLIAGGTSLPELATSMVAARKGSSAIAIGNVIGSNLFNIFFVLGTCAVITPVSASQISSLDLGVMLMSVLLLWGFSYTKRTVARWEGGILALSYVGYIIYLIFTA